MSKPAARLRRSVTARSWHRRDVRDAVVHAIRALDRRTGLTVRRGQAAYATAVPRLAGSLHHRILADVVAWAADHPAPVVVDVGSGPGTLTVAVGRRLPAATLTGVEPGVSMLEIARATSTASNVRFVQGCAEHLPIDDASVDLVISSLSAHHWDDLSAAVGEIRRVLRPHGRAWIYDLRFATFTDAELAAVRKRLALPAEALLRSVPRDQGRLALFAVIAVTR